MLSDSVVSGITNEDIELAVERLLEAYAVSIQPVTFPIPVESIAEHFLGYDLEITDEGLFTSGSILGGISFETNTIFLNASIEDHDGRYAFTVAHEIGHHELHRDLYIKHVLDHSNILCREVSEKPLIEKQADRFAAALLVPRSLIESSAVLMGTKKPCRTLPKALRLATSLKSELELTNVSLTAMVNRLKDLGYVNDQVPYQSGKQWRNTRMPFLKYLLQKYLKRIGLN
jgi:Zn-dependent peptidase ImmA (M78 family)